MNDKDLKWLQETAEMLKDEANRKDYEDMIRDKPEVAKHFAMIINPKNDDK